MFVNVTKCMWLGDPCADNPCLNGGQCHANNFGGFTCQCPTGYSGQRCQDCEKCIELNVFRFLSFFFVYKMILVLLNRAWIRAIASKKTVVFVAYVHLDLQALDVIFVRHVKVILAWMEAHAKLLTIILAINAYVLLVIMAHIVKLVRILHDFLYLIFVNNRWFYKSAGIFQEIHVHKIHA